MTVRLQKILSQWGIASRRRAEQLILAGRVRVNGEVARLGQTAEPTTDRIEVDGKLIAEQSRPEPIYLLLNKPVGVVSTCFDPQGRSTVLELLPPQLRECEGIHPVGRLDIDSSGALLLTNDGDLTFRLTHPRHSIGKTYAVWVQGRPTSATLAAWRNGIDLDGRYTLPARVTVIKQQPDRTLLEIVLVEGRNRQIRRVAAQLAHPVIHLHRTRIGNICIDGARSLPIGSYRHLQITEIHTLQFTGDRVE
ncbi:pseudouridine synthase [Chamaesiphon polymorphus]|uniref:Pseudouridine synthase n=1 Tax=Chamaesiphon polymorphus CCALA 037 TaxID=2107692 RepID=A0A2T1FV32_9CYAN|nr:pseudouridine synthase [Chamaesiphon polymorphus]PSB48855.1 pseudouridine synthase [Chamaesiphon polymorphus CCALA 037]